MLESEVNFNGRNQADLGNLVKLLKVVISPEGRRRALIDRQKIQLLSDFLPLRI